MKIRVAAARGSWPVWLAALLVLGWGCPVWAEDDFRFWNTVEISRRLSDSLEFFTRAQQRVRDDASELFYHEYRQGVRWTASEHLQLGFNYLFARNESSGKPLEEHRGELDITPKAGLGPLKLSVRGRIALRTREDNAAEEEWRFRLRPKVAYPMQLAGRLITPYVADDLFYDTTADAWNQNRLYLGATVPLGTVLGAETDATVYYMLQSQRSVRDDWSSHHVLGTKLRVQF